MQLENKHSINLFRDDESRTHIQNFLNQKQQEILKDKLEKGQVNFENYSAEIPVKNTSSNVFLDGATEQKHFNDYQFLKRTQSEIVKPIEQEKPAGLKKNLKQKVSAANLQTEADLKIYGEKLISAQKQTFKQQRMLNIKTG